MRFFLKTAFFISLFASVLFLLQCERIDIFEKAQGGSSPSLKLSIPGVNFTDERGTSATVEVKLGQEPAGDVTVSVSLDAIGVNEAVLTPATLVFTAATWDTASVVTVTGMDDGVYDGNVSYKVEFTSSSTGDTEFDGLTNNVTLASQSYDRYIFVSADTLIGNFGGTTAADNLCNADPNKPSGSSNFMALIADGSSRVASLTANTGDGQVGWVLEPDYRYYREDGAFVGKTGTNSLFEFPLTSEVKNPTDGISYPWTGLTNEWLTSDTDNNTGWTGLGSPIRGNSSMTDATILDSNGNTVYSSSCPLICVEKP